MAGVNTRISSPKGAAPPPGDYQTWDAYMADEEADAATRVAWKHDADMQRVGKAMRLAPNILVFRALLDGQPVPADALDQRWVRRYGL